MLLISFLFEFLVEVVFEVALEGILTLYMKLMTLIVPEHQYSIKLRERIKKGVAVFAALLFLCFLVGLSLFLQTSSFVKTVGAYMVFIPLGIMGLQIVAGIIYRIIKAVKAKR